MEYLFIQQISLNGVDLELELLKSATLSLSVNALAPFLKLRFLNPHNTILEDIGIQEKDEIKVRFMDIFSEDVGNVQDFVVCDIRPDERNANFIVFECLEKHAYHLSQRDTKIFNKMSISSILGALVPGLEIDCGQFPVDQYYDLANDIRFNLVAKMASEHGAIVFISKRKLVFKTKEDLLKEADIAEYEYRNKGAQYQIKRPKLLDRNFNTQEQDQHFIGWNIEKGLVQSTQNTNCPVSMVNCSEVGKLNNLSKSLVPAVRFQALGEGKLEVGSNLKLVWNSTISNRPIDESYPSRILLGDVVLHADKNFVCTICGYI